MGRTVVDPLIRMVCVWPVETGAGVVADPAEVAVAVVPATGAAAAGVSWGVAAATGAEGEAAVSAAPLSLAMQPAASASRSTATRLTAIVRIEPFLVLMVFHHPFHGRGYTDFRHKLYISIYTIETNRELKRKLPQYW
jgi:hypothetical protein